MEKKLAAAVRREFAKGLTDSWPGFEPVRYDPPPAARGARLYRWQADPDLWFFLYLGVLRSNEFIVELLWHTTDTCPFDVFPGSNEDIGSSRIGRCEIIVRAREGSQNKCWKVGPNPKFVPELVVPAAIREMKAFAMPIIEAVLDRHGSAKRASPSETA
jgi:hypothetical protein